MSGCIKFSGTAGARFVAAPRKKSGILHLSVKDVRTTCYCSRCQQ